MYTRILLFNYLMYIIYESWRKKTWLLNTVHDHNFSTPHIHTHYYKINTCPLFVYTNWLTCRPPHLAIDLITLNSGLPQEAIMLCIYAHEAIIYLYFYRCTTHVYAPRGGVTVIGDQIVLISCTRTWTTRARSRSNNSRWDPTCTYVYVPIQDIVFLRLKNLA